MSRRERTVVQATRETGVNVYISADMGGRRVGILILKDGHPSRYAVVPHPSEVGRVVLVAEE